MQYIELIIIAGAAIFALALTIYHLTSRFNSRLSRLFTVISLCAFLVYTLLFVQLLQIKTPFLYFIGKMYYVFLLFTAQAFFHVMQIFPGGSTRKKMIAIIITSLPGLILAFFTITTNMIIYDETYLNNELHTSPGIYYDIYRSVLLAYIVCALLITIIKSIFSKNRVFRNQMRWLLFGFFFSVLTIAVFSIALPLLFNIVIFKNMGHALGISNILAVLSFAVVDIISLNLKKFYIRTIYMGVFFSILYIPVVLALYYGSLFFSEHNMAVAAVSIILFIYLAVFFAKIRPWLDSLFQWDYRNMARSFNETFPEINQLPISSDRNEFWAQFYENSIGTLAKKFQIASVYFFLNNRNEKKFDRTFISGKDFPISSIPYDDDIIKSIRHDSGIINRMVIDFDNSYSVYSENLKLFFNKHKIEIMIPFFDYDRECTGILFLGGLHRTIFFSRAFLFILDLFRIQFQRQLLNALILEDVKARQIIEHDKIVAKSIKKKILPSSLGQVEGIRISSLHINNSQFGGDYFDSIIAGNRLILFIADTSYSDIESGILSLELYTVLHTPSKYFDSPEKIVHMMNWVTATSRFSNRYASAFCLSCSQEGDIEYTCAAFNPLIIFDPAVSSFTSHESQGIPIGVDREFIYEKTSIQSGRGSIGILYSTGLITALNPAGDAYSIDRLKNIIKTNHDEQPSALTRLIYEDLLDFMQGKKQINDITIIVFKVTGK